jgi:hypothetical protein
LEGVKVDEPPDHKLTTEKGLMVRSQLSKDVVVQTVYHSWVKRKLSTQEQANVLDFPVAWLADNNFGEMFLSFPLHPDLKKYCGIDLSQLFPEFIKEPSPFHPTQAIAL